jgi:TRAP-type C4-dicarboxylate transport system permease small subunit
MTRPPLILMIPLVLAALAAVHMAAMVMRDVVLRYGYLEVAADSDIIVRDLVWVVMLACGAAMVWRHDPTMAALSGSRLRPWQRNVACIVAALSGLCCAGLAIVASRRLLDSIATGAVSQDELPMWSFHLAPVVGFALAALLLIGVAIARFWPTPASDRRGAP